MLSLPYLLINFIQSHANLALINNNRFHREIWSSLCFDSCTYCGCSVLPLLRICWFVHSIKPELLELILSYLICKITYISTVNWCRSCWCKFAPVLQPEQFPDKIHTRLFRLPGLLDSPVLQRVHGYTGIRPRSHLRQMGTLINTKHFNFLLKTLAPTSFLIHLNWSFPVQRHHQRALLIGSFCCWLTGILLGQHPPQEGRADEERQGQELVGQVPLVQDRLQKWGILLPTLQLEQILPICVMSRALNGEEGFSSVGRLVVRSLSRLCHCSLTRAFCNVVIERDEIAWHLERCLRLFVCMFLLMIFVGVNLPVIYEVARCKFAAFRFSVATSLLFETPTT